MIFRPNFVCVLTNKRYKTGFLFWRLGHAPGVGIGGSRGAQLKKKFVRRWLWCISNWRGWWVEQNASTIFILGSNWWHWGEVKNYWISITKSISKIFIPNFVCVLTNKRYETYRMEFSFCRLGHAPGVGLGGAGGQKLERGDLRWRPIHCTL